MNNVLRLREATRELQTSWHIDAAYVSSAEAAGVVAGLNDSTGIVMTSHHFQLPPLLTSSEWFRPLRALQKLRKLQRFYLERWVLRKAHRVTAVSGYGRDILYDRDYLPRDTPVEVIPNGVHRFWFETPGPDGGSRGAHHLFVGRMDDQKGVDILFHALASTPTSWPVKLIGDGWQRQEYEALAGSLGVGERVQFLGHQDKTAIRKAMAECGSLVVPSRSENYPLVLLEGMACGCPVVASAVGGVGEMIETEVSGLLVEAEDSAGLGAALVRLEESAALRRELATGGSAVAERHQWPKVATQLGDLLGEAATEAQGRRSSAAAR